MRELVTKMGVSKTVRIVTLLSWLAEKLEKNRRAIRGSHRCAVSAPMVESAESRNDQGSLDRGGRPRPNGVCQAVWRSDVESDRQSSAWTHRQTMPRKVSNLVEGASNFDASDKFYFSFHESCF